MRLASSWNRPRPASRRAFTPIEILVAVSVIALLIGLVLPAVQAARESARRAQCLANLRQLGVALHAYHTAFEMFPPGIRTGFHKGVEFQWGQLSPFTSILPYIEQRPLFDAVNFDLARFDSLETPLLDNQTARLTRVAVFLCPSDGEGRRRVNYRFNKGWENVPGHGAYEAPFCSFVRASAATITDGLSRTAFLSLGPFDSDTAYIPVCLETLPCGWLATSGRYWCYMSFLNTAYNHNGTPYDRRPSCGTLPGADWNQHGLHPPRSYHPGGVHVLFGDGHTELVRDGIQPQVWIALGTHHFGDSF